MGCYGSQERYGHQEDRLTDVVTDVTSQVATTSSRRTLVGDILRQQITTGWLLGADRLVRGFQPVRLTFAKTFTVKVA